MASTLPPYVRADIIGSIAARHMTHRDLDDLCAQLAVGLGWTMPGGYPRTARVRELLGRAGAPRRGRRRPGRSMRRHVATRILVLAGAGEQEYHDMLHKLTCGELGAEDMAYINGKV